MPNSFINQTLIIETSSFNDDDFLIIENGLEKFRRIKKHREEVENGVTTIRMLVRGRNDRLSAAIESVKQQLGDQWTITATED